MRTQHWQPHLNAAGKFWVSYLLIVTSILIYFLA